MAAVILNWNHTDDTIACASHLQSWASPPQVWVADNGSKGNAIAKLLLALPNAYLLDNKANLGFGGGNNGRAECVVGRIAQDPSPRVHPLVEQ
ncbi:MAG: hypothetical protein HC853_18680 [Anaerolineae bacterium]|nr:hypothetical protein [Anaerolineae bacterium]